MEADHPDTGSFFHACSQIGARLAADLVAFRDLPAVALEPCEKRAARVSSTSLVRYRCNDYSAPTSFGFREVLVKGFVDEVVILCAGEEIARHRRPTGLELLRG